MWTDMANHIVAFSATFLRQRAKNSYLQFRNLLKLTVDMGDWVWTNYLLQGSSFIDSSRTAALSLRRFTSAGTSSDSCHAEGNNKGDPILCVHFFSLVATDFKPNIDGFFEHLLWKCWISEPIGSKVWRLNLSYCYMNYAQHKSIHCRFTLNVFVVTK
jgi:hypothetical protein